MTEQQQGQRVNAEVVLSYQTLKFCSQGRH